MCSQHDVVCLEGGETSGGVQVSGNVMVGRAPVCDDSWGLEDANVVCRELGWPRARQFTRESYFGQVNSTFRSVSHSWSGASVTYAGWTM